MNDQEYIKHFNRIFGTNITEKINNMPLLEKLFEYFEEDLYTPSEKYEKIQEKKKKVSQKLEQTFNKGQQKLFLKYWELENNVIVEEEKQLFMFGFIIGQGLMKEIENNDCQSHQDLTEEKEIIKP